MQKIICVDMQPAYDNEWLLPYLKPFLENKEVLFLYNSEECSGDTFEDIFWYLQRFDIDINQFQSVEKSYAFFRNWMDYGIDEGTIIQVIRYMMHNGIYDSRDIDNKIMEKFQIDCNKEDCIFIPDFLIDTNFSYWNNTYLIGGGINQCLAEIRLWLEANWINYKLKMQFIY